MVLRFVQLQINQDKAPQDTMVEDQIDPMRLTTNRHAVLPTGKRKPFAQFQQKRLQIISQQSLQIGFGDGLANTLLSRSERRL